MQRVEYAVTLLEFLTNSLEFVEDYGMFFPWQYGLLDIMECHEETAKDFGMYFPLH